MFLIYAELLALFVLNSPVTLGNHLNKSIIGRKLQGFGTIKNLTAASKQSFLLMPWRLLAAHPTHSSRASIQISLDFQWPHLSAASSTEAKQAYKLCF